MVSQCTVFIALTVQNIVLQPAWEAKGKKYITCKEHLRQNDHSLNWFPPREQPQYYLNGIDHSIDRIESWSEPISRHCTCLKVDFSPKEHQQSIGREES